MVQQCKLSHFVAALSLFFFGTLLNGCGEPVHFATNPTVALPAGSFTRLPNGLAEIPMASGDAITRIDVREKTIYIVTAQKNVTNLDRKAFKINFVTQVETPSDRLLPAVELQDKIIFPTATTLEFFDYQGVHLRSLSLGSPLRSGAAGTVERIYFGADDPAGGRVMAVDLSKSYAPYRWQLLTPGGSITSAPVLYKSILYVASEAGDVYAVNENRSPIWNIDNGIFKTAGPVIADLKANDTGLYVASKDSQLYCINLITGKLKWHFFAGAPLDTAPVPTKDTVYQAIPGVGLAAIDVDPNAPYIRPAKWVYPSATHFLSQDDKYAYLVEPHVDENDPSKNGNVIIAVNKQTGKKAFESQHTDFDIFGINEWDSTIYAGYTTGQVLAITPVLNAGRIGELVLVPKEKPQFLAAAN